MWTTIVVMALWGIIGIATLCQERISKTSYLCLWLVAMMCLLDRLV